MKFLCFCVFNYRFKPSSERRRHPDLAGSAKPGLSSPTYSTRPDPPPGGGGGRKTKAAFRKNPLRKCFQKRDPPPPPDLIRLY